MLLYLMIHCMVYLSVSLWVHVQECLKDFYDRIDDAVEIHVEIQHTDKR